MNAAGEELIGQQVGSYQIVRLIGVGGMGVVYESQHIQLKRRTAIKILNEQSARNPTLAERFWNEARIVSVILHPGLISVLELGSLPNGTPYMVMEYLEGESLGHRIRRTGGRLGADALRLGRQIASTLGAVHARGVIHRDLKPDNIMIVADPEAPGGERAKLLDFGIAKITLGGDVAAEIEHKKTRTGALLGTPVYMAPEQCRGACSIDHKADVYSLGVMLFEMLVGAPPFQAEGTGELMALHMYHPPPQLLEIAPWVSADLATLVQRMLSKDPQDRPTALEVAGALEQLGAPRAVTPEALQRGEGVAALPSLVARSQPRLSRPFSVGSGQLQTSTITLTKRRPLERRLLILVLLLSGAFGVKILILDSARPAARPQLVRWRIATTPPGAAVSREETGERFGTTPFDRALPPGSGEMTLRLELKGFRAQRIVLRRSSDENRNLHLEPVEAAPAATVTWSITSTPPGATVTRAYTGELLGKTPLRREVPRGLPPVTVRLQLAGHQERTLTLDGRGDEERNVTLVRDKKERKGNERVRIEVIDDELPCGAAASAAGSRPGRLRCGARP